VRSYGVNMSIGQASESLSAYKEDLGRKLRRVGTAPLKGLHSILVVHFTVVVVEMLRVLVVPAIALDTSRDPTNRIDLRSIVEWSISNFELVCIYSFSLISNVGDAPHLYQICIPHPHGLRPRSCKIRWCCVESSDV